MNPHIQTAIKHIIDMQDELERCGMSVPNSQTLLSYVKIAQRDEMIQLLKDIYQELKK